jgi:hypothetical protein
MLQYLCAFLRGNIFQSTHTHTYIPTHTHTVCTYPSNRPAVYRARVTLVMLCSAMHACRLAATHVRFGGFHRSPSCRRRNMDSRGRQRTMGCASWAHGRYRRRRRHLRAWRQLRRCVGEHRQRYGPDSRGIIAEVLQGHSMGCARGTQGALGHSMVLRDTHGVLIRWNHKSIYIFIPMLVALRGPAVCLVQPRWADGPVRFCGCHRPVVVRVGHRRDLDTRDC